ncbi:hypothetical protein LSAT2_031113 [Lamellibrachia satsuma]|nr:hypothetical protein LSAT2_031113 [Lamellibrachia satsuma]
MLRYVTLRHLGARNLEPSDRMQPLTPAISIQVLRVADKRCVVERMSARRYNHTDELAMMSSCRRLKNQASLPNSGKVAWVGPVPRSDQCCIFHIIVYRGVLYRLCHSSVAFRKTRYTLIMTKKYCKWDPPEMNLAIGAIMWG